MSERARRRWFLHGLDGQASRSGDGHASSSEYESECVSASASGGVKVSE